MDNKKGDLDTHRANSDSTVSIPSGSDSNRSETPDTVVGNNIKDMQRDRSDLKMNVKHPGSISNGLVKQEKVDLY